MHRDFYIRNGFMDTDLYIIGYFLCFCSCILESIMGCDRCIIITTYAATRPSSTVWLAFTFKLSVIGVFNSFH